MKSKALCLLLFPESTPAQIETLLLAYAEIQQVHHRLKLLFQAAQGACLCRLQETHGFKPGGDRKSSTAIKTASCGFDRWEDFVRERFGFSDDKALRLMNMWRAMAPLLEILPDDDRRRIADFLRRPMLHLTPPEIAALEKVTHKIATFQHELDSTAETPFIKQSRKPPHNPDPANNGKPPVVTPDEIIQEQLNLFTRASSAFEKTVKIDGIKVLWISRLKPAEFDVIYQLAKNNYETIRKIKESLK